MAYIGKTPVIGNFQKCDAITVVNGQASYTMQVGGTNVSPESENHMLVSLNGILQAPVDSFTVSGSTITFASNLQTGDVIDFIMLLGNVLDLGVPSDNTVSTAKLVDGSVTSAKLSGVTQGITMVDGWRINANTNQATNGDVSSNWERIDTDSYGVIGTGLTESSGVFTFPETGIYSINLGARIEVNATDSAANIDIQTTTDNSSYNRATMVTCGSPTSGTHAQTAFGQFIFDVTNTTTHKFKFVTHSMGTNSYLKGSTDENQTYFYVTRLGNT